MVKTVRITQATLNGLLEKVTRLIIKEGGVQQDKAMSSVVLFETPEISAIREFANCLQIVEVDEGIYRHCICYGQLAFEFFHHEELMATLSLHHGKALRWKASESDVDLADPHQLMNWLAKHSINQPLEEHEAHQQRLGVRQQVILHWKQSMPDALRKFEDEMLTPALNIPNMLEAYEIAIPDVEHRALALFHWLGAGTGSWIGYPAYENLPLYMLLEFPTAHLVAVASNHTLTTQQMEGAARYFSSRDFRKRKAWDWELIPAMVKSNLLKHALENSDKDKQRLAWSALA